MICCQITTSLSYVRAMQSSSIALTNIPEITDLYPHRIQDGVLPILLVAFFP